jgi:hypothetical protein
MLFLDFSGCNKLSRERASDSQQTLGFGILAGK